MALDADGIFAKYRYVHRIASPEARTIKQNNLLRQASLCIQNRLAGGANKNNKFLTSGAAYLKPSHRRYSNNVIANSSNKYRCVPQVVLPEAQTNARINCFEAHRCVPKEASPEARKQSIRALLRRVVIASPKVRPHLNKQNLQRSIVVYLNTPRRRCERILISKT